MGPEHQLWLMTGQPLLQICEVCEIEECFAQLIQLFDGEAIDLLNKRCRNISKSSPNLTDHQILFACLQVSVK